MSSFLGLRYRTPTELLSVCEAMLLHVLVRAGLRVTAFARFQSFLERSFPVAQGAVCSIGEVTWAIGAAGRRIGGTTCLVDALVAYVMLRRRGHDPRICIGVRQAHTSGLEGHAWVERQGTVVIGELPGMTGYARLA